MTISYCYPVLIKSIGVFVKPVEGATQGRCQRFLQGSLPRCVWSRCQASCRCTRSRFKHRRGYQEYCHCLRSEAKRRKNEISQDHSMVRANSTEDTLRAMLKFCGCLHFAEVSEIQETSQSLVHMISSQNLNPS